MPKLSEDERAIVKGAIEATLEDEARARSHCPSCGVQHVRITALSVPFQKRGEKEQIEIKLSCAGCGRAKESLRYDCDTEDLAAFTIGRYFYFE